MLTTLIIEGKPGREFKGLWNRRGMLGIFLHLDSLKVYGSSSQNMPMEDQSDLLIKNKSSMVKLVWEALD